MLTTMQLTQFVMGIILSSSTYVYGKATQEQVGSLVFIQVSEQRKERSETSPECSMKGLAGSRRLQFERGDHEPSLLFACMLVFFLHFYVATQVYAVGLIYLFGQMYKTKYKKK